MKAKDYYAKYAERLRDPATTDSAIAELVRDFAEETKQLMESRGVKTVRAVESITNEMNAKWNKLADMLPVLKHNGWKTYFTACLSAARKDVDHD